MWRTSCGIMFCFLASASIAGAQSLEADRGWNIQRDRGGNCHLATRWFSNGPGESLQFKIDFKRSDGPALPKSKGNGSPRFGMCITVANIESISGFDPDFFEGPDAPGQQCEILFFKIISKSSIDKIIMLPPSGSYSVEKKNAFQFEVAYSDKTKNSVGQLLACLSKECESFSIGLYSPNKIPKVVLFSTSCSMNGMKTSLQQFLAGCPSK